MEDRRTRHRGRLADIGAEFRSFGRPQQAREHGFGRLAPRFHINIVGQSLAFPAGSTFSCEYKVEIPNRLLEGPDDHTADDKPAPRTVTAIETSILWYTSGKGDEDIGVHFFERREKRSVSPELLRQTQRLNTILPYSPVSYNGAILTICWVVRVRLFLSDGVSFTEDRPFRITPLVA